MNADNAVRDDDAADAPRLFPCEFGGGSIGYIVESSDTAVQAGGKHKGG